MADELSLHKMNIIVKIKIRKQRESFQIRRSGWVCVCAKYTSDVYIKTANTIVQHVFCIDRWCDANCGFELQNDNADDNKNTKLILSHQLIANSKQRRDVPRMR